ncbi:MAG: alpha-1,4-glucan--maltose-1-phosphate maltosyltransferase [Candidatus Binataceae bacterium]|nr:alpha-1,4-glucan--maltose-1-phosphate maltosyltransferase [Candidatus Binataceae bacterium]
MQFHHHVIENVTPAVDGGRYPAKRIAGEPCIVEADIYRDGHPVVRAAVRWRRRNERSFNENPMTPLGNDRWRGEFPLAKNTRYVFTIIAWTDSYASWLGDFRKWVEAGRSDVASELLEGIALLKAIQKRATSGDKAAIGDSLSRLSQDTDGPAALAIFADSNLNEIASRCGARVDPTTYAPLLEVIADRPRAMFSAWYEMFPRSQGNEPGRGTTFREAAVRLDDIQKMGFDVVYLPPIHPIGHTFRKGPNNSPAATPDSPGSPWAIGSDAGGHTAIEPALGDFEEFGYFVAEAIRLGIEVALDFALQCSPDHPWVSEHPDWFYHRPDGSIRYAENPPKEYQDIYPLNFDSPDRDAMAEEIRSILRFWIEHGVKIFRVDNPHTKPVDFWEWLIGEIQQQNPEVIFLAEAFTRPKMMKALAKAGFTQSYTYFTWRNTKLELTEYLTELTQTSMTDYFRPNFFANTPDILMPVLQNGGPAAFRLRLVLAGTLSPSYGIYSGYELCEHDAIPGTEDYRNSEKYEIKVRDWNKAGNIKDLIAGMNRIRRSNPALQQLPNLSFLSNDSDQILVYVRATADMSNVILVAVNLDPFSAHECTAIVPPAAIGLAAGKPYTVTDLLTGNRYQWSERNYIRLDPQRAAAHVFLVSRGEA